MSDEYRQAAILAHYIEDTGQPDATRVPGVLWNYNARTTDAVLNAATPHLRRQFREEIFAELIAEAGDTEVIWSDPYGCVNDGDLLSDWLNARKEQDDAQ